MKKLTIPTPEDIEKAAKSRRWTIKDMCRVAGVADETFSRWKKGRHHIRVDKLQAMLDALATPKTRAKKSTVLSTD